MSSNPVLVLDIDGVVSLAQPGGPQPWDAHLQRDWGFGSDELVRDFFRKNWLEVVRGRLDLGGDVQRLHPHMDATPARAHQARNSRVACA